MSVGRLVPWISWHEWDEVRIGLLEGDSRGQEVALQRIATWRARGRIPLGVDMTACLTETRLKDGAFGMHGWCPSGGDAMLRLQYSMAVIRLVNGVADSSQKGRVARSVADLASDAGLPRLLVDIRHEASHNELPNLALLRLASTHALTWLQDFYWQGQMRHRQAVQERLTSHLKAYVDLWAGDEVASPSDTGETEDVEVEQGGEAATAVDGAVDGPAGGSGPAKARKQILAQLRDSMHSASAASLLGPLLDAGLLLKSDDKAATDLASWQGTVESVIAGLTTLCTGLPALMLEACVRKCIAACLGDPPAATGATPEGEEGTPSSRPKDAVGVPALASLAKVVLEGVAGPREPPVGKRKRGLDNSPRKKRRHALSWVPAEAQVRSLLRAGTECLLRCQAAAGQLQPSEEAAVALTEVVRKLPACLHKEEADKAMHLLKLSGLSAGLDLPSVDRSEAATDEVGKERSPSTAAMDAAQEAQAQLFTKSRWKASNAVPTPGGSSSRWTRVADWTPCAIGCIPSPCDPCGQLPPLNIEEASLPTQPRAGTTIAAGGSKCERGGVGEFEVECTAGSQVERGPAAEITACKPSIGAIPLQQEEERVSNPSPVVGEDENLWDQGPESSATWARSLEAQVADPANKAALAAGIRLL